MFIPSYNDRLRLGSASAGDPEGMGRSVQLSELANMGRLTVARTSTLEPRHKFGAQQTQLVLTNFPIAITSITTGIGVGGSLLLTFPLGYVRNLLTCAELSVTVETQADVTDATPEGDLGIGTLAPANADALGTDATDDNWGDAVAYTMSNYVDASVAIPPVAAANFDGRSTAISLFLNGQIDAADIDDGVTTNLLITGNIWINWVYGGGV